MRELVLAKVGHVAVFWNEAEHIVNRLLWLYLDTDVQTAEILTQPMRATDREKLLRALVAAKEIDPKISAEIDEALRICGLCRENRNTILHNAGGDNGEFAGGMLDVVTRICGELSETLTYLRSLQVSVTKVIFSRGGRDTPIGDESSADELLPLVVFEAPERPKRPRKIQKKDILRDGYGA